MTRPHESVFPWAVGDFSGCKPEVCEGMTKRELFAAMAQAAAISGDGDVDLYVHKSAKDLARAVWAVKQADALIEALNKNGGGGQ